VVVDLCQSGYAGHRRRSGPKLVGLIDDVQAAEQAGLHLSSFGRLEPVWIQGNRTPWRHLGRSSARTSTVSSVARAPVLPLQRRKCSLPQARCGNSPATPTGGNHPYHSLPVQGNQASQVLASPRVNNGASIIVMRSYRTLSKEWL